ncbi:hypothetical protein QWY28_17165 [Nocardioides sp. SOB77]|uniref:Uncharacterized protein n=1 Tax=Nocardioides oceani TaxID=3058369 RepID=A0ABT8FJM2_9ACTN|nr:hypothetical protein [Nocardioides oceani]MDN4174695.1 hypothetical protein [Nocardioides oceani]
MIAEAALHAAGPDAVLVARPTGVAHIYTGPLTPGGSVPRRCRPACGAHTRRLTVIPSSERRSSLDPSTAITVCARCSARLSRQMRDRRAEPNPVTATDYRNTYGDLTRRDLWADAVMAETLEEIEAVAHLSLVLLGHPACEQPLPVAHVETQPARTLTQLIGHIRERLADYPNRDRSEAFHALVATGYAQTRAERHQLWQDREQRIARLGINNATARP